MTTETESKTKTCRYCHAELIVGVNYCPSYARDGKRRCRSCDREKGRRYRKQYAAEITERTRTNWRLAREVKKQPYLLAQLLAKIEANAEEELAETNVPDTDSMLRPSFD